MARVVLGLHREKVAREQDQVRALRHRALRNPAQARDRHEWSQVRVRDLHDTQRALGPLEPARCALQPDDRRSVEHDIHDFLARKQRIERPEQGDGVRQPWQEGSSPNARKSAQGKARNVAATNHDAGTLTSVRYKRALIRGRASARKLTNTIVCNPAYSGQMGRNADTIAIEISVWIASKTATKVANGRPRTRNAVTTTAAQPIVLARANQALMAA